MAGPEDRTAGRFRTGPVLVVSAGHFIHDVHTAFLAPLLPLLMAKLGLNLAQAGSLAAASQIPSILNPLFGSWVDRGAFRRLIVILTPGVTGTLMCLMGLAPTYGALIVILLAAGLSSAGVHLAGPVLIGQLAGSRVGRGMSFFMAGGELARTAGPLIAVQLVSVLTLEGLWRCLPVAIGATLLLAWQLRGVEEVSAERRPPGMLAVWRTMRGLLGATVGIVVARAFMVVALTTFLPTFLYGEGETLWAANISLSLLELTGVAGVLTAGSLSDRIGRRRVLFGAFALAPPLMVAFLFAAGPLRLVILAVLGFVVLSTTPVLMAVVLENSGANPATANGTYIMIAFTIRSLVVLAVGALGDAVGLRTAFLISAGLGVLGLPFVLFLPGRRLWPVLLRRRGG